MRVAGVFPDLIGDPLRRCPPDPEIAAANRIIQAADNPAQRRQQAVEHGDLAAEPIDDRGVQDGVAEPGRVRRQQVDPLGRAVHGAVVRKRPAALQLRQERVVRESVLVDDPARLLLRPRLEADTLEARQRQQRRLGHVWEVV